MKNRVCVHNLCESAVCPGGTAGSAREEDITRSKLPTGEGRGEESCGGLGRGKVRKGLEKLGKLGGEVRRLGLGGLGLGKLVSSGGGSKARKGGGSE